MSYKTILYDEPLSEIIQKHFMPVFNYPKEKIWNQEGASLERRIKADSSFAKRVDKALTAGNLERYIVSADIAAPARCVDGRITVGWKRSEKLQKAVLGPKAAGGTVYAALAYRIVDAEGLDGSRRLEDDVEYVVKRFNQANIGSGGHGSDSAIGHNTGCGAVDNINLILDRLQRPEHQEQLRGLTSMVVGETYGRNGMIDEIVGRALYLDALKPSYMPKEAHDPKGEFMYKGTVVKALKDNASCKDEIVPALAGPHNEVAAILNFVPDTTFDTDRFSYDNHNDIQVFGWDAWAMYEEAGHLYPCDIHDSPEKQRRSVDNRIKYVIARTLLGVSTIMVLTDGSLRLATVAPARS